ncbi:MAG: group II intron reverse transcriptase/maturase [Proteobacteria bacterium]|nr:group II intron reverse transcriptase/maturase [Pseudomonadota bacterium]
MQNRKEVAAVLETTKQATEAEPQDIWWWVEASIWTESMLAALENGVKGGRWYSLIDKVYARSTLEAAWKKVSSNRGAAGVDRVSVKRFEAGEERYMAEQDRIVQTALKMVLEPIYEREFLPMSYGFRPGRGCKDALREVDELVRGGKTWYVDADICSYFDSIPHEALMGRLAEKVSDGRVLKLIEGFLKADIMEGLNRWTPIQGSPQGAVMSPLLSNLYLHPLDEEITGQGYRMIRYADDFIILCESRAEALEVLDAVARWMEDHGLKLHAEKTQIGNCAEKGQGFEFLGYRFEQGRRTVRKKSWKLVRDRIREKTKRTCGKSIEKVIEELNPMLRGWFGYFKHAQKKTFRLMDGFTRRRLRAIRRKQERRPGQGRTLSDHMRWPNAYFADLGLFTMVEAHRLACQSR